MTAAHCIDGTQDFIFTQKNRNFAKLGCNLDSVTDCYTTSFDAYWFAPNYNAANAANANGPNDVGLLRMETLYWYSETSFPSTVGTICLASRSMPNNERVITTGWGGTDGQGQQSQWLKEVRNVNLQAFKNSCMFHNSAVMK